MNTAERIRTAINNVDAILLLDDKNRQYASGLHTSSGAVLICADENIFITDFRYYETAKKNCLDFTVIEQKNSLPESIDDCLKEYGITTVGFEENYLTVSQFEKFKALFDVEFVTISSKIMTLRSVKSPFEIDCIKKAQQITDAAFMQILNFIKAGKTEKEVMAYLEYCLKLGGADGLAFESIVVSGKNSSMPHGVPTDKPIHNGEFVTMDFGAKYMGYCSDMTRTVCVGQPNERMRSVYEIVLKANMTALEKIKAGITGKQGDAFAREYIAENGYEKNFGHGLGHSLGLDIHEEPRFSPACNSIIPLNTVITVEPGIYLENEFGVRIEDLVIIKDRGCLNLTNSPKNLIVL